MIKDDTIDKIQDGINNKLPAKACVMVKITEIYNAMWGPAAGKQIA
jgi:uncharacterized protein